MRVWRVMRRRVFVAHYNVAAAGVAVDTTRVFGPIQRNFRVVSATWVGVIQAAPYGVYVDIILSRNGDASMVSGSDSRSVFEQANGAAGLGIDAGPGFYNGGYQWVTVPCGVESQQGESFLKVRIYDPSGVGTLMFGFVAVSVEELVEEMEVHAGGAGGYEGHGGVAGGVPGAGGGGPVVG